MARASLLDSLVVEKGKRPNLAARLEAALPSAQVALLKLVAEQAAALNLPLYVVGGVARDLLLERPIKDLDLVVEGNAIRLGRALVKEHGGQLRPHKRFGTAKWELATIREELAESLGQPLADIPAHLDLISARQESYPQPGALPKVEFDGIEEDQRRRDFGINTLALRLDGEHYSELHDPWGGLEDLQQGHLRVLHSASFVDDPTRMLRILRFAARFGFAIEDETEQQLKAALRGLEGVSADRIRTELDAILREPQRAAALRLGESLGVLQVIHPALQFDRAAESRLAHDLGEPLMAEAELGSEDLFKLGYLLWLADLDADQANSVDRRLHFPRELRMALDALVANRAEVAEVAGMKPSEAVVWLEKLPLQTVYAFCLLADRADLRRVLERYLGEWRHVAPSVDGNALKAQGLPPGPAYGRILAALRAAWLDGAISSPEEETALLAELVAEYDG